MGGWEGGSQFAVLFCTAGQPVISTLGFLVQQHIAADGLPCCLPCRAAWIKQQQADSQAPCSPLTGLPLEHLAQTPNRLVRSLIASLMAGQPGAAAP